MGYKLQSSKILNNLRSIFRSGIVTKTTTMICMEVRVLLELPLLNFFRSVSGIINSNELSCCSTPPPPPYSGPREGLTLVYSLILLGHI